MMYSVATLNLPAPSCRPSSRRYARVCLVHTGLGVIVKLSTTQTAVSHVFVSSAEAVLRAGAGPPSPGETGTMHHSARRPGFPPGAAGTLSALKHFYGSVLCCVNVSDK